MKYISLRPQKLISIITELRHNSSLELLVRSLVITLGIFSELTIPASAQITYEGGKAATQAGSTVNIPVSEGNKTGANLFHSFDKFNVNSGQTANFISTPDIQNILSRVNGANGGSLIDGKLQVTGSNANLFLMNPAGIVFGKGASLDINGAFTATTAKAIDFGNGNWFNAVGANTYGNLNGNPIGLAFPGGTPGSIFSAATFYAPTDDPNLLPDPTKRTTNSRQSIRLVGGTVISTGNIKTDGGNISISTVDGGKYVQIKTDGSLLRLDLPASAANITPEAKAFTALSLPELLTNTKVDLSATGVKNENGVVTLVGNPAANALVPNLDKAKADYQKADADYQKADADYKKADADYFKALAAVGNDVALVNKAIITARDNAKSLSDSSLTIRSNNITSLQNIQEKFDSLSASSVFGEPSLISAAISRGDTVSTQNRRVVNGDIIVKKLDTSALDVKGGNVHLDSSRAILIGDINTRRNNSNSTYLTGELNSYGGKVVLTAQTEIVAGIINSGTTALRDPNDNSKYLPTAGGAVTMSTQKGDIIVESISTGSSISNDSTLKDLTLRGGDLTVNAKGLFRVITNTDLENTRGAESINSGPFGKIDIKHGGTSFVTGADEKSLEDVGGSQPQRKVVEGFKFLDRESGARGFIITSRLGNGSYSVVYTNSRGFYDFQNKQSAANGSTIQSSTSDAKSSDLDQQASKPKSKENCTPSSTSVASNPTAAPTRSAGNANAVSADPCQQNTSNSGILQILNDRE